MRSSILAAAAAAALLPPSPIRAQQVLEPAVTFPEDFGTIQTVRELSDGRLLVADPLAKELYLVDMDAGTRTVIGSEGQGPGEYRQPDAVWPLPGGATLLVDLGNGRLTTLGPDLSFGETRPISQGGGGFQPGRPLVLALPQAVDGSGGLYFRSMAMGGPGGELPDSGDVMRLLPDGGAEAVARFKVRERRRETSGGANSENVRISQVPLSPEDAWGVAADGSIVVARSGDYHVEWIAPDGTVTAGAPIPYDPVRIGTAEKEEWVVERGRDGGGVGISVEVNNGQASMSFARGGVSRRREIDQYTWPDRKPPFYGGRIPVDGEGRAWVRRHVDAGDPSTYDLFDRTGAHVGQVRLGPGKGVVGFGPESLYAVSFDAFDLSYLERYPLPST